MFHERHYFFTHKYGNKSPCSTCGKVIHCGERIEITDMGMHIHHRACYLKNVAKVKGESCRR